VLSFYKSFLREVTRQTKMPTPMSTVIPTQTRCLNHAWLLQPQRHRANSITIEFVPNPSVGLTATRVAALVAFDETHWCWGGSRSRRRVTGPFPVLICLVANFF
jgi:hypothetical protein